MSAPSWSDETLQEAAPPIARLTPPTLRSRPPPPPPAPSRPPHVDETSFPNPFETADRLADLRIAEDEGPAGINFDAYDDIPVEASGADVPPPASSFAEIDLGEAVNRNIARCGFAKPTPVQRHAIPIALAGRDLMACAQTGSGKTAAFCFPIISGILKTCPLRRRHHRELQMAGELRLRTLLFCLRQENCPVRYMRKRTSSLIKRVSGLLWFMEVLPFISRLFGDLERGVDILVATPGRLVDLIERARVSLQTIKYLALDEADRMLDMGFEPQVRKIVERLGMPPPAVRQTMLFSATFPLEMQRLAADFLSNYVFLAVGRVGSSSALICQRVDYISDVEKGNHLRDLLYEQRARRVDNKQALTLVFVETKRGADFLEHWLSVNGLPATSIHGDKTQRERELALKSFKSGATPIMVATDIAARGLDIPHVAHVINFDLPKDIDNYVHRIGRTGRAGKSGLATAFFTDSNQPLAKALAELMREAKQEVPDWLLQFADMSSYGRSRSRRPNSGGRFGGRDYRRDSSSWGGNYQAETYGGTSAGENSHASANYEFGHEWITPTGWD
uniref:RNA helicase n=1 Tax=Ananas comosus var. bracteatus TaxID=296719 RepID=A0A6V7QQA6_ANACO